MLTDVVTIFPAEFEVGAAAVLPLGDVVGVAASHVGAAAGEHAVPVPGLERPAQ